MITFNNTNVFASKNLANIPTTFEHGWVKLGFPVITSLSPVRHRLTGGASTLFNSQFSSTSSQPFTTFNGLPVIGFAASTYVNGNVGTAAVYYAGRQNHRFTDSIQ